MKSVVMHEMFMYWVKYMADHTLLLVLFGLVWVQLLEVRWTRVRLSTSWFSFADKLIKKKNYLRFSLSKLTKGKTTTVRAYLRMFCCNCAYVVMHASMCNILQYFPHLFSKHRPSRPMPSISQNDHICVCVFICMSVHFWGTV